MATLTTDAGTLSSVLRERWEGGGIVDFTFMPAEPTGEWRIAVEIPGEIVNIWNAVVLSRAGDRYVLGNAEHNARIAPGNQAEFGLQVNGDPDVLATAITTSAADDAPPPDASPAGTTVAAADDKALEAPPAPAVPLPEGGDPAAAPADPSAPPASGGATAAPIGVSVADIELVEPRGSGATPFPPAFAPGFFSTRGAEIVDATGTPAEIHGVNWFGFETETFAPHGLWARNWQSMMDQMKALGFNVIRLPFSGELVLSGGGTPSGIDFGLNRDLEGLNGLQIMDRIVDYADRIGMRILLDYHRGPPGAGPNYNGLWYGDGFTVSDWIDAWLVLAERYRGNDTIIGADLVNEPHSGVWGGGGEDDWPAAAERAADAVGEIAPDWLMVVEGVGSYEGDSYWWGGNLQGVADRPVRIDQADKLVYSPHDYPPSVFDQPWFRDGSNLYEVFRKNWGFIQEQSIAPVLIGEWGSKLQDQADMPWANAMVAYLSGDYDGDGQKDGPPIGWMWWSWNPNSGDTDGILLEDWTTPRANALQLLEPFLEESRPTVQLADVARNAPTADFAVTLTDASRDDVILKYSTVDGTALAGVDYLPTAGQLTFSAGEQRKVVSVPILSDTELEGNEVFSLSLSRDGAEVATATAVIADPDRQVRGQQQPTLDLIGVTVSEAAGLARFRVLLDEPAPRDIEVVFETEDGSAASGTDFEGGRGSFTIPAGASHATVGVRINQDGEYEGAETFTLRIVSADGAAIRRGEAVATIAGDPREQAAVDVTARNVDGFTFEVDLVLEEDWGSGALFNISVKNGSTETAEGWRMGIDLPFDIEEIWSAELVADNGERVTIEGAEWNASIAPGETINFGFIAGAGDIDLTALKNGADLSIVLE